MGVTNETHTATRELTVIDCGECGGSYAISEPYREKKQETGGFWTCPYCKCGWGYSEDKTDLAKAKEAQRKAEQSRDYAWQAAREEREKHGHTERRRRAEKAAKTRLKNRVGKGVCPCCNRHFVNLQRHIEGQHPEFAGEGER